MATTAVVVVVVIVLCKMVSMIQSGSVSKSKSSKQNGKSQNNEYKTTTKNVIQQKQILVLSNQTAGIWIGNTYGKQKLKSTTAIHICMYIHTYV